MNGRRADGPAPANVDPQRGQPCPPEPPKSAPHSLRRERFVSGSSWPPSSAPVPVRGGCWPSRPGAEQNPGGPNRRPPLSGRVRRGRFCRLGRRPGGGMLARRGLQRRRDAPVRRRTRRPPPVRGPQHRGSGRRAPLSRPTVVWCLPVTPWPPPIAGSVANGAAGSAVRPVAVSISPAMVSARRGAVRPIARCVRINSATTRPAGDRGPGRT